MMLTAIAVIIAAKVVHSVAHRNHYRSWMTGVAIAIPWISGVCTYLLPTIATTRVMRGRCVKFGVWANHTLKQVRLSRKQNI